MDAETLRSVMGSTLPNGGYTKLIDAYNNAARAAGINTVRRAAMWAAQLGHESVGLRYMEEIASGAAYEGRQDLGNVYAGDGVRFKGRGPIQLTGRANYRAFTKWANANGHSTIDFEANPHKVSEPHWGFLAATYYWTVSRPDLNKAADAGDVLWASRLINGWVTRPNGLDDRIARYNRALKYGTRLLPGAANESTTAVTPSRPKVTHPMGEENGVWRVSSGYGSRWGAFHAGLDFAAPLGTPIYAVADATVVQGKDRAAGSVSGFGNWVWLDAQSTLGKDFIYGHMRWADIYVKRGDRVKAGDLIARVGSEGGSTGPHLHFEVWGSPGRIGGRHEDPAPWLKKNINTGEELTVSQVEEIKKYIDQKNKETQDFVKAWITGFIGPIGGDVKDVRQQVTGGRDSIAGDLAASYPGWDVDALVNAAEDKIRTGQGLTTTEMLALAAYEVLNNSAIEDGK